MPVIHRSAIPASLVVLATSFGAAAEDDDDRFSVSAEIEIGVEAIRRADDPDEEVRDLFLSGELELEYRLSDRVTAFAELAFESLSDAERDRAFDDIGLYLDEVGLSFDLDPVTLKVGKFSPAFGSAWDTAPGYFGADFAEDYELEEMIGAAAEMELGAATLTLSAFYLDDTLLSESWGTHRGRNSVSDGEVGNTGKLNNFALQYDREFDNTTLHFGLRHLAQGEEENDENAIALGLTHSFGEDIEVIAELAHFNGWEGTQADANIATIGASLTRGAYEWSVAISERRVTDLANDRLIALGVAYEFDNGMTLSAGYARVTEEEEDSDLVAISLVIPFD